MNSLGWGGGGHRVIYMYIYIYIIVNGLGLGITFIFTLHFILTMNIVLVSILMHTFCKNHIHSLVYFLVEGDIYPSVNLCENYFMFLYLSRTDLKAGYSVWSGALMVALTLSVTENRIPAGSEGLDQAHPYRADGHCSDEGTPEWPRNAGRPAVQPGQELHVYSRAA